jgi:hypothetical protein
MPTSSKWPLPFRFPDQNAILILPVNVTCSALLILLALWTAQSVKQTFLQFFPGFIISYQSKYSPQHPDLKYARSYAEVKIHLHRHAHNRYKYSFRYSNPNIFR